MSQSLKRSLPRKSLDGATDLDPGTALLPADPVLIPGGSGAEESNNVMLRRRLATLGRHLGKLLLLVAACAILTGIYVLRLPPLYDSTAVVRVDPNAPQNLVGQDQSQPTLDNTVLMTTEQTEIKNPGVVIPAITALGLETDPSFHYTPPAGAGGFRIDGVPQGLLQSVLNDITVTRPPQTFLLNITFRARTPELAARAANAVAESLLRHEYQTRSESLRASSQYLSSQVDDLRAQMEKSQKSLTAYEQAHDILSPNDRFNLLNQRLSTVATDLDKQREAGRHLEAELALARAHDVDAILVSGRGESLKPLMDAYHAQQLEFDSTAAKYGPADPVYKEAARRLSGYQDTINSAMDHIALQIQAEAQSQQVQTTLTQEAYDQQKSDLEAFNANAAQYALLQQQAESQAKLYDDMLQRIQEANVAAGYHSNGLRIVSQALPSASAAYPHVVLSVVIAIFISSLLGIVAVLGFSSFDRSLTDPESVLLGTGERLIGSVPLVSRVEPIHALWGGSSRQGPTEALAELQGARQSAYAEAIFTLRTSLFLGSSTPLSSLAVTSAQPRDGKTTTSISLAASCARQGMSTIIVDADLRRPEVHRALGLSNRHGLSSLCQHKVTLEEAILPTGLEHLWVLPAGPAVPDSTEVLGANIGDLVEELKNRYRVVFVDCPPALGFADSMIVGPAVDAVLVVARAAVTPREYVRAAVEQLRGVRANVAGIVLNGVSAKTNRYYSYYRHYTSYYSSEEAADTRARGKSGGA